MNAPTRPVLRWHGGKWKLAPWIIGHFPAHRIYVEPYGGAASVLIRKEPSFAEIYNDLDTEVVTLFRILRDERAAARLIELLRLTPFARGEFDESYLPADDPLEIARRLVVRSYMGFGSDSAHTSGNTGFRAQSPQSGRSPEKDWLNYPPALALCVARLRSVVIENRPAMQVMERHDSRETLHYVDPPYLPETRSAKSRKGGDKYHVYQHELSREDHAALLAFLPSLAGMVALSGYASPLYEDALTGWRRLTIETHADGARPRTEIIWLNPACVAALDAADPQPSMFGAA
jgi:DNA adenine methylase